MKVDFNEIYSSCHVLLFGTMSHLKKSVVQFSSPVKQYYKKQKTKMNMPDNFYFRQPVPNCMITGSTVSELRRTDTNSLFILDFKLSPCFESCLYSFGYFPGV